MIEVVSDIKVLSQKTGIKKREFPPFYYKENYKDQRLIYVLSNHIVVPIILSHHYFLKKAQFVFYPLLNNERISSIDEVQILNDIMIFLREKKLADRILPPPNYLIFKSYPKNADYCNFGTYYLDLSLSLDELWKNVHSKHKNVIRNAENKGCKLLMGNAQLEIFYDLYSTTMKRSQLSYLPLDYFMTLSHHLTDENLLCAVAYYDNKPQGALLIPFSQYGAYYIFGGSSDKVEPTGLNNYMHWEMIKLLKEKGVKRYDFVGARLSDVSNTKLSGIQMFKERFGSILEKGYLWKMDLNFKCKMYDFLVRFKSLILFKKQKYKDIIDQERLKMD